MTQMAQRDEQTGSCLTIIDCFRTLMTCLHDEAGDQVIHSVASVVQRAARIMQWPSAMAAKSSWSAFRCR